MSSPVEHVYFVGGSLQGKTLPIGCGVEVLQNGDEVYRREGRSQMFYLAANLSSEVRSAEVKELQRENV